ncbi:hypothetical protein AK830_g12071 [Neonectria ditissima]|uniref:Uncharacterized protein n=1 Tax=Neonectria ditissima TaxID=78410 RepID=A0A0P7B692_9HYPO|nr:hypothetical protein AK830_g12071 [Neonectria ditissima]
MLPLKTINLGAILLILTYGPLRTMGLKAQESEASIPNMADEKDPLRHVLHEEDPMFHETSLRLLDDVLAALPRTNYAPGKIDYTSGDLLRDFCRHFEALAMVSIWAEAPTEEPHDAPWENEEYIFHSIRQRCYDSKKGVDSTLREYERTALSLEDTEVANSIQTKHFRDSLYLGWGIVRQIEIEKHKYNKIAAEIPKVLRNLVDLRWFTETLVTICGSNGCAWLKPQHKSVANMEAYSEHMKAVTRQSVIDAMTPEAEPRGAAVSERKRQSRCGLRATTPIRRH